jgi:hypothetical protein
MPTNKEESRGYVSNNGVLKDSKTGRWIKGTKSPNPTGRPIKKRDVLDKLMKTFYGPDCEALLLDVVEIAQYNQLESKDRVPRFTSQQITRAREFLFEQFYGKPMQETKTELTTPDDIKIQVEYIDNDAE